MIAVRIREQSVECPQCHLIYQPDLSQRSDFYDRLMEYDKGRLIQDVWPEATRAQREQLMIGLCSDECFLAHTSGVFDHG